MRNLIVTGVETRMLPGIGVPNRRRALLMALAGIACGAYSLPATCSCRAALYCSPCCRVH